MNLQSLITHCVVFCCSGANGNLDERSRRQRQIGIRDRDFYWKHLAALNLTKKNKEIICSSNRFSGVITKLFDQENFEEINKIDEILGLSVLEIKTKGLAFHYKEKYSKGGFYVELENKIFSPRDNIIFAYSKNKADFLEFKMIELPSSKDVDILYKELKSNTDLTHLNLMEKVDLSFKEYKILALYKRLNNSLKQNINPTKKIKI